MSDPSMTITFAKSDEGVQRAATATTFAAFWRDRFGSIHFFKSEQPDFDWDEWFSVERDPDEAPRALNDDEFGHSENE